jgi:hypothetical protein
VSGPIQLAASAAQFAPAKIGGRQQPGFLGCQSQGSDKSAQLADQLQGDPPSMSEMKASHDGAKKAVCAVA